MGSRIRAEGPATDGTQDEPNARLAPVSPPWRRAFGLPSLLAVLSFATALIATIDELALPIRVLLAALVAVGIACSTALLARRVSLAAGPPRTRTDSLTGLADSASFEDLLASELDAARANGHVLALLIADLDSLCAHEEWFGREARDRAVQLVGRDLQKWKRRIDRAAHLGGGEFALLLPGTDARGAMLVAERMRRAAHRSFASEPSRPTLSLGVAIFPEHGRDPRGLTRAARRALAAAKELGRDRSALFSHEVESVLHHGVAEAGTRELRLATVIALAEALDLRDTGATTHARTVARCAELTALELDLPQERRERVHLAGMLHDVGAIGVPAEVLAKPGPLDDPELAQVRTHPQVAARLLAGRELADLRTWIEAHHERPDGTGYPRGLRGDQIPLEARILAAADAWEGMTSERPHRPALDESAARAELLANAGTQFDPDVVDALLRALARERAIGV